MYTDKASGLFACPNAVCKPLTCMLMQAHSPLNNKQTQQVLTRVELHYSTLQGVLQHLTEQWYMYVPTAFLL